MTSGNICHQSSAALILIDVINDFDFPDGDKLLRNALPMAPKLARLKERARRAGIPAIYVNDNFGQWRSEASKLLEYCLRPESAGREFVEMLRPEPDDYFVLKPMHSAFFQTPLELLLGYLGASSVILCGLATNSCIVCTAHDANMRELQVYVPSDCSAAKLRREHEQAIRHLAEMADANTTPSTSMRLGALRKTGTRKSTNVG